MATRRIDIVIGGDYQAGSAFNAATKDVDRLADRMKNNYETLQERIGRVAGIREDSPMTKMFRELEARQNAPAVESVSHVAEAAERAGVSVKGLVGRMGGLRFVLSQIGPEAGVAGRALGVAFSASLGPVAAVGAGIGLAIAYMNSLTEAAVKARREHAELFQQQLQYEQEMRKRSALRSLGQEDNVRQSIIAQYQGDLERLRKEREALGLWGSDEAMVKRVREGTQKAPKFAPSVIAAAAIDDAIQKTEALILKETRLASELERINKIVAAGEAEQARVDMAGYLSEAEDAAYRARVLKSIDDALLAKERERAAVMERIAETVRTIGMTEAEITAQKLRQAGASEDEVKTALAGLRKIAWQRDLDRMFSKLPNPDDPIDVEARWRMDDAEKRRTVNTDRLAAPWEMGHFGALPANGGMTKADAAAVELAATAKAALKAAEATRKAVEKIASTPVVIGRAELN